MAFSYYKRVWELEDVTTTSERILLLAIAEKANDRNDQAAWHTVKTWSEMTKLTDRGVRKVLAALESRGLIAREPRFEYGRRVGNTITLLCLRPEYRSGLNTVQGEDEPSSAKPITEPVIAADDDRARVIKCVFAAAGLKIEDDPSSISLVECWLAVADHERLCRLLRNFRAQRKPKHKTMRYFEPMVADYLEALKREI